MIGARVVTRTPRPICRRSLPAWIFLNGPPRLGLGGRWLAQPLWYLRVLCCCAQRAAAMARGDSIPQT